MHHGHRHEILQPLQRPRDQGAMRPGAGKADVQSVAAGLGTMSARAARSRAAISGQPVAEARFLAPEPAVLRRVVPLVVPFAFDQQAHWILLRSAQSRSEEHTSELPSLMRISYAVFC